MSIGKAIYFFATAKDLEPGLHAIESQIRIKYVLAGMFESHIAGAWKSAFDIPNLSIASAGAAERERSFLVLYDEREVRPRNVSQRGGGVRIAIDQMNNSNSIVFKPGGRFEQGCIIRGEISTTSEHQESLQLFKVFSKGLTKGFKKIHRDLVGAEALQLMSTGIRLTSNIASPKEFDLNP